MRWWWRLFTHDNRLWKTFATAIYALNAPPDSPLILTKKGSFFWNSIRSLRPLFHSCSQFQIISGRNISFWYDGWDGLPLANDLAGPLSHKNISLCQAKASAASLLPAPLTFRFFSALQKLRSSNLAIGEDRLLWTISSSGDFSVKSLYVLLSQAGKLLTPVASLWTLKVTPSMRMFLFLMLHNKILTQDNLQRRSIPLSSGCVMCSSNQQESVMHLFFRCSFAHQVWTMVSAKIGFQLLMLEDSPIQTFISSSPSHRNHRLRWGITFVATTWLLWKERNSRVFRSKCATASSLSARIMQEVDLCSQYC